MQTSLPTSTAIVLRPSFATCSDGGTHMSATTICTVYLEDNERSLRILVCDFLFQSKLNSSFLIGNPLAFLSFSAFSCTLKT